jgi:hypothetical protein
MEPASEEARRGLERRALRNVRGLIDKVESHDRRSRRFERRILVGILAGALAVAVAIALLIAWRVDSTTIVVDPARASAGR